MAIKSTVRLRMLARRRKDTREHLKDPYPGLSSLLIDFDPNWDADHSLPLVRYRILVNGKEDAAGEFHYADPEDAVEEVTDLVHTGRYGHRGLYLAEVEVYDAGGKLLGRDRQVLKRRGGQVVAKWERDLALARRVDKREAMLRRLPPAFPHG